MSEFNLQSSLAPLSTVDLFSDMPPAPSEMKLPGETRSKISDVPQLPAQRLNIGSSGDVFLADEKKVEEPTAPPPYEPPQPEEEPWTLGRWFNTVRAANQKIDALQKLGDAGPNKVRGYNRAYFETMKSVLRQHMAERVENEFGLDQAESSRLYDQLTRDSAGYRSKEDIDEIHSFVKNGVEVNGAFLSPTWEEAMQIQKAQRFQKLKKQNTATGGGAEEISRWQNVLKNTLDAEGNVMADRMGEFERANSELDRLTGAPTGVSKFAHQYNRVQDKVSKMTAAMDSGIPYKGMAAEQIPAEILKLNQETVELAVENAPYFGPNDRDAAAKWITDPATKGLPFRSDYEGKKIPHFVTSEPGVYNIWSPQEKSWMVVDKRKPKEESAPAPQADNSQFSAAGQTGQKIRRAAGKLAGAAESGMAKAGAAVADILPLSVNTGASVIEGAAGIFDTPLKLDRMDYLEERARKNKVGKYRDK